jgi:hypothetical protein
LGNFQAKVSEKMPKWQNFAQSGHTVQNVSRANQNLMRLWVIENQGDLMSF